jgi:hypothetical protein
MSFLESKCVGGRARHFVQREIPWRGAMPVPALND